MWQSVLLVEETESLELATCRWFSLVISFSSTNKTDRLDITEILLKVVLNTITHTTQPFNESENGSLIIVSAETEYISTRSWYRNTTDTASSALFLDVYLEFDDSGQLSTKIYDKRDDFNFKIINFPNMCSNIPASFETYVEL
jgi:hypothetical protein